MPEKIKITKKEIEDIYDVIPDIEDTEHIPEVENKNFTFDEYTVEYDKEHRKVEEDAD